MNRLKKMASNITLEDVNALVNEKVNSKDLVDYSGNDLELIINNIARALELDDKFWVEEYSDGKYRIFSTKKDANNFVDVTTYDTKKSFADSLYNLFIY